MTTPSMPEPQPREPMPAEPPTSSMPEPQPREPMPAEPPNLRYAPPPYVTVVVPKRAQTRQFAFVGGAGTFFGTALLGLLITVVTLGICYPFALVLRERWHAKNSYIEGRQLVFNGSAWGLFGLWWKWLILLIITLGIYGFWVGPRLARWKWENTSWARPAPA